MALGPRPTPSSNRSSTSEDAEPLVDLRLLLPALGAWAGAGAGVLGGGLAAAALAAGLVIGLVALLRRAWTTAGLGVALTGATLVAWWWSSALAASQPAQWAAEGAFMEVQAVVTSDTRTWEPSGNRPGLAITPVRLISVSARGQVWEGGLPAEIRVTGAAAAEVHLPVGATVSFEAIARPPEPGDRSIGTLGLRSDPIVLTEPGPGALLANRFRAGLRASMAHSPPEQAGLVPSLVVGDTGRVSEQVRADFQATGLTHLTAVSGTNLTLMLVFALALAKQLGLRGWWLRGLGVGVAVAFVVVCRAEPSVLRAAAMGLIAMAATGLARDRRRGLRALCLAVIVLVLVEPWLALAWGFALSVTASAGILWWGAVWQQRMRVWAPGWLAESLAIPLAAQLATQSIVTALSGNVSVVGVAANMAAGPFVGPVTILGLAAALVSLVSPALAGVVGWLAGWCAQPILLIAAVGADAPAATWRWPVTLAGLALLAAGTIAAAQIVVPWVIDRRWAVGLCAGLLLLGAWRQPPQPGWPGDWVVLACDVGQGGAQLIRAGPGQAVLVDTGPDPDLLRRCLTSVGVTQIPLLVITHPHADHIGGLPALDPDQIGLVLVGPPPGTQLSAGAQPGWLAGLPAAQVTRMGDQVQIGALRWTTLAAGPVPGMIALDAGESAAENDSGVVGLIEVGGLRVLVTGDLEVAGQQALVASGLDLRADVLVVPHHGSPRQDPEFLAAVAAAISLIQVGERNDYGHPAASTLRALEATGTTIFRTDLQGAIAVGADGREVVTQR